MDDKLIIDLYWQRSERAISETDEKYSRFCHYIAYNILGDDEDSKEIVNEVYLKAWNTIPPNRPGILKSYLGMICRQLAINRYQAKNAQKRKADTPIVLDELGECIPDKGCEEVGDGFALRDALSRFVASLPVRARRIFVRRYWYAAPVSDIAREYSVKESYVTVSLLRTRRKLKAFLEKEGFAV